MDFVLCFVFGLILFLMNMSLSFLFFLFFFLFFSDFIWFMRKKETTATERMREWEGKKKKRRRSSGENERKINPKEREIIDKISSFSNILMQEIRLLMHSSSSNLMSYCSLAKKKGGFSESTGSMNSRHFEHFLSIFYLCIGCWRCS